MTANKILFVAMLVIAASAWISYVERPTRRNLGRALRDTLPLL
jgi:hypothetical protein